MQTYRNNAVGYINYRQPISTRVVDSARKSEFEDIPLAMAYVPWQKWQNIYDAEKGFCNGTIFQDLDLPFYGVGGCQNAK